MDLGTSVETSAGRLDAWAMTALREIAALEGVHRAGVAVVEGGGRRLLFTASDRDSAGTPDWCHIDSFDDVPLTAATRRGRLVVGMLDDLDPRYEAFARAKKDDGAVAIAAIPLAHRGRVLGGCVLYFDSAQRFDARRCQELSELGGVLGARLAVARNPVRRQPRLRAQAAHGRHASYEVPAELAAVPDARGMLRDTLETWGVGPDVVASAVLCLSEVVTNALIHTDGGCQVQVSLVDGLLTVRVHDLGVAETVNRRPVAHDLETTGRGLQIVEAMATRAGRDEDDAVSWFEIEVPTTLDRR